MHSLLRSSNKKSGHERGSSCRIILGVIVLCAVVYCLHLRNSKISHLTWAQENSSSKSTRPSLEESESAWKRIQELQESLKKKESEIEEKNRLMEQKEQRLALIKEEIIQQIENYQSLKKEIEEKLRKLDEQQEESIKKLSKIFEGAPPEEAGSIIARTDIPTAAEIIMRMDKRKAGKLWGNVDPKLAAGITKFIMKKNTLKNEQISAADERR